MNDQEIIKVDKTIKICPYKIKDIISIDSFFTLYYYEYHKNFSFSGESHDFWEMVYVDTGEVLFTRDNEPEQSAYAGQAIFHKPCEFHKIRANGLNSANVFVVSFSTRNKAIRFFENKVITLDKQQKKILANIIQEAQVAFKLSPIDIYARNIDSLSIEVFGGMQITKLYFEVLLILFLRADNASSKTKFTAQNFDDFTVIINEIIAFLKDNIFKRITIQQICKKFNYSKTYISTKFKEHTGHSILEYCLILKIDESKRMIREKNLSFAQISQRLGFKSYSHFYRTFKKITNSTPKEYTQILKVSF